MPTPAELGYRMPAEWRRHAATWLSWPKDPETWPDRVPQVEEIFLQMMAALAPNEIVNLLVDDAADRSGCARALSAFPAPKTFASTKSQRLTPGFATTDQTFLLSDKLHLVVVSIRGPPKTTN